MAITYIGKGNLDSGNGSNEVLNPTLPASLLAGDLMIILCTGRPTASDALTYVTTPTGWTLGSSKYLDSGGSNDLIVWYYYRFYVAGDGTPAIAFNNARWYGDGGDLGEMAFVVAYRGVNTTFQDLADVTSSAGSGSTFTPTGLTTLSAKDWVLSLVSNTANNAGGLTISTSQDFTTILAGTSFRFIGGVDTNDHQSAFTHKEIATPSAVTCPTYTGQNEIWCGITIALKAKKTISNFNGLAIDSVKTINGVAISSVKNINGLELV